MEFNFTAQHFAGFLTVAFVAMFFLSGARLWRAIGWAFFWQMLSPTRPMMIDVPLMVFSFGLVESIYLFSVRGLLGKGK